MSLLAPDARSRGAGWLALWIAAAAPSPASAESAHPAPDPVEIFYDGGDCGTDAIEIQVFDRETRTWVAHPEHPRVSVPSCQIEDAGLLLNELRWRCAGAGSGASPPWRNLAVFESEVWARCTYERILEEERERIRAAQRKRLELRPETEALPRDPEPDAP